MDLHLRLTHDVDALAASGQGWAAEAQQSKLRLYVSAAGFTDDVRSLANADPSILLLSLEDLY